MVQSTSVNFSQQISSSRAPPPEPSSSSRATLLLPSHPSHEHLNNKSQIKYKMIQSTSINFSQLQSANRFSPNRKKWVDVLLPPELSKDSRELLQKTWNYKKSRIVILFNYSKENRVSEYFVISRLLSRFAAVSKPPDPLHEDEAQGYRCQCIF